MHGICCKLFISPTRFVRNNRLLQGVYNITRYSGIYTQNLFILLLKIASKQTEVTIVLKYAVYTYSMCCSLVLFLKLLSLKKLFF